MTSVYRQRQEPRTDWFRVLADLARAGAGNRAVARRLHVARSTVLGWKSGSEPRHSDGELLLDLWVEATGRPRDEAPQVRPHEYR